MSPLILCTLLLTLLHQITGQELNQECSTLNFNEAVSVNRILEFGQNSKHDSGSGIFPCWFDLNLARTGQNFARKNFGHLFFVTSLSLIPLSSDEQSRRVILTARRHNKPKDRLKANLATAQQVLLWYQADVLSPQWTKSIENVRQIHMGVSSFVKTHKEYSLLNNEVGEAKSEEKTVWNNFKRDEKMWEAFKLDLKNVERSYTRSHFLPFNDPGKKFKLNQYTMAMAHWAFIGLAIVNPESSGLPKHSEKDLQGFAHLWATIGYGLGIEEQFLYCKNPVNDWADCKKSLRDTFVNHLLPQLFELDAEGETVIESALQGISEMTPGISPDVWLISFLEKHLGVRAVNLRKQQNVASIVLGSTASWFVSDIASQAGTFRVFLNNLVISMFRHHSLNLFGDDGTNSTIVADKHYSWDFDS